MSIEKKVDLMLLSRIKKRYPHLHGILTDLLSGCKVSDIAIKYDLKESSVRNLKSRYREYM